MFTIDREDKKQIKRILGKFILGLLITILILFLMLITSYDANAQTQKIPKEKTIKTQIIKGQIVIKLSELDKLGLNDNTMQFYSYNATKQYFYVKYNGKTSFTRLIDGKINLLKLVRDLRIKNIQ